MDIIKAYKLADFHKGIVWRTKQQTYIVTYPNENGSINAVLDGGIERIYPTIEAFKEDCPIMYMQDDCSEPGKQLRRPPM
jgi:hypothetical protein